MLRTIVFSLVLIASGCGVGREQTRTNSEHASPSPATARGGTASPTVTGPGAGVQHFDLSVSGTNGLGVAGTYLLVDDQGSVQVEPLTGTIPIDLSLTGRILIVEIVADSAPVRSGSQEIRLNLEDNELGFWAASSKDFVLLPPATNGPFVVAIGNRCDSALMAQLSPPLPPSACGKAAGVDLILYPHR